MNDVLVQKDTAITMRDGVELAADVYRPGSGEQVPVLLYRTPYGKNHSAQPVIGYPTHCHALVEEGYAVVIQDCRGRFGSGGEYKYCDPLDTPDGVDTIEWIASQPWCNGKVAMLGTSYLAIVQFMAAIGQPKGLAAIVPGFGGHLGAYVSPGVPSMELMFGAAVMLLVDYANKNDIEIEENSLREAVAAAGMVMETSLEIAALAGEGTQEAFARIADVQQKALGYGQIILEYCTKTPLATRFQQLQKYVPWMRHFQDGIQGDMSYWNEIDYRNRLDQLKTPTLHVVGWFESHIGESIDHFVRLSELGNPTPYRLIIAPVTHFNGPGMPVGEKILPLEYSDAHLFPPAFPDPPQYKGLQKKWLAHWLKDEELDVDEIAPITLYVLGENVWREEYEWPLARTRWTPMYLGSDGRANTESGDGVLMGSPRNGAAQDQYVHDPANPVPTVGGGVLGVLQVSNGVCDQAPLADREDVLFYTSEPLQEEIEITGPVSARLWIRTTALDTDFCAKLVDVEPGGSAYNICSGITRLSAIPGEGDWADAIRQIEIKLSPTSFLFKAGHRIRLQVTSSNFPEYDINPNTGISPYLSNEMVTADQTIFHDDSRQSHLLLPIIPR